MRAWRLHQPGGPEAFVLEEMPRPQPVAGHVLIEVRAFGLNRSEWFTRIGESPTVKLPRVLGIECVGTVVEDPSGELAAGQRVAAMMGGMGRQFDGSYAQYTSVPSSSVFPLETELPWEVLGALPEMLQTCHGSLHTGLEVQPGETLLIRGGTSSIGLATLEMAKQAGRRRHLPRAVAEIRLNGGERAAGDPPRTHVVLRPTSRRAPSHGREPRERENGGCGPMSHFSPTTRVPLVTTATPTSYFERGVVACVQF